MGPVENMNKKLCGLLRCFRIYLREKAKLEITTESPLLPWLVRHSGWILSRYAVRADGRTGYSRLKGREYTSGIAKLGEAIWHKLPKTADLTKVDDRCRTISSTEGRRQALERKSAENGHRNALESSPQRGGGETTEHHASFGGEIRSNRTLRGMLPQKSATHRTMSGTI